MGKTRENVKNVKNMKNMKNGNLKYLGKTCGKLGEKLCATHSREVKPPTPMSGKYVVLFLDMRESQRYQFAFGRFKWKNVGGIK